MMELEPYRTKVDQRVQIKSDVTQVYPNARAYMEGIVSAQKRDEFGYPMVWIKWDKNHWAYSGEQDGWTLEAHFNPVERKVEMEEQPDMAAVEAIVRRVLKDMRGDEPAEAPPTKEEVNKVDMYQEKLRKAVNVALEADGFILLIASKESVGDNVITLPFAVEDYRNNEARVLLGAALSDLAAQSHAALAFEVTQGEEDDR